MSRHTTKPEVAALVKEFGAYKNVVLTVDDAQDVAEFFAWFVRTKLGLSDSLQLTTVHSVLCVCDTVRQKPREINDGYCVAVAAMVPLSGSANDFAASLLQIMIQQDPSDTSPVSEACPNGNCTAQ